MTLKKLIFPLLCLPLVTYAADFNVQEKILGNGLKILIKEDHRTPVVVSQVWYKVGSSYETNGITGISHMLEHMMFKGTKAYPAGEFSKIISENGGEENAFTGDDYTAYFQTLEKSRLEISFKLEADRMRNLQLRAEELTKELEVVTEERRMRTDDQPRAKMQEQLMAMAFANSPYKNPIIGWPADIAAYQVEDLQIWYQQWYAPNNATLVIVGDVDPAETFVLAESYFAPLAKSEIKPLKPQTEIAQQGVRKMTLKLPAKLPYLMLGYKVPSLKTSGIFSDAYALEVVAAILDGGNSARFSRHLIRGQQIASSATASYSLTSRLSNLFTLEGTPADGKTVAELESAIKAEIKHLQTDLVTPEELQRVKAQVMANTVFERDSHFYQAMLLGSLETVGLGWHKYDEYLTQIQQITAEQIRQVAKRYFIEDHLNVAYLEPQPLTEPPHATTHAGVRHAH